MAIEYLKMAKSYEFISQLIAAVRENSCLYHKKDAFYYNKIKKQEAWDKIALRCDRSSRECRERWKLLRERFCKHMKKVETYLAGKGEAPEEWQFFHELMFLKDSIVQRRPRHSELKNVFHKILVNNIAPAEESNSSTSCPSKRARLMFDKSETQMSDQYLEQSMVTPKIEPEDACSRLGEKVDKSVETDRMWEAVGKMDREYKATCDVLEKGNSADELFARNIVCLMKDLPINVKDKFQANMYAEIFKLRAQVRG